MSTLLQIILLNLIVSFDNIGVIALASRGLPPRQADLARQLGIWLSLILKFIFIILIGRLFAVEWLHIRLIGGLMLIYVIYGMIGDGGKRSAVGGKRFSRVILSIVAADVSMSLDNVIAVLSIVSNENGEITITSLSVVFLGLAICVPVLLWFSEAFIRWMEKSAWLRYFCAGYLAYIAAHMIFEDDLIENFLIAIRFPYPGMLAVILGLFTVMVCWNIDERRRVENM